MSREPRGVTGHRLVASTEPYLKNQQQPGASSTAVATAAAAASGPTTSSSSTATQTISNTRQFDQIEGKRLKPLPPDANAEILRTAHNGQLKLYQLERRAFFNCAKCRKANVQSDLLAVNYATNSFMCSRCFTKLIRPMSFKPTRLVPFPSLLSWLNFQKPQIFDPSSSSAAGAADEKVSKRFAEAVVPTGDRLATGLAVNGFANNDLRALPSSAMATTIGAAAEDAYGQQAAADSASLHPCGRLWGGAGRCAHGAALCAFAKAPYVQAIEYLMGIATREQCVAAGLRVDDVFGLPRANDPMPTGAYGGEEAEGGAPLRYPTSADAADPSTPLGQWVARRKKSLNQPEWQLFNNGPLGPIIDRYAAFAKAPGAAATKTSSSSYASMVADNASSAAAMDGIIEDTDDVDALLAAVAAGDEDNGGNDEADAADVAAAAASAADDHHVAALMDQHEDDDADGNGGDDVDLGALLDMM